MSPPSLRLAARRVGRPRRRAAINSSAALEPKIVAVVDHDPGIRRATARLLSAFGFVAETFDSAGAFLNATASRKAACLVIDIQIGGMTGVDLSQRLAAGGCKCPIIFTSTLDDQRTRSDAAAAGGVACLHKPFPVDLLIETVIKAIG